MACEEWDEDEESRRAEAPPAEEAYLAFLLEHTGLPRRVIDTVLEANDRFWDLQVARWGLAEIIRRAQEDDMEADGG